MVQADGISVSGNVCRINATVDLNSVKSLRQQIESTLEAGMDYQFDLDGLDFEGSAVLALLVQITRWSKQTGARISFEQVPPRLQKMLALNGIDWLLREHTIT